MKDARAPSLPQGLTAQEAKDRLEAFGPNQFGKTRRLGTFLQFLYFFANPLVIVLLIASTISFAVGNWINASIIISMVILSVVLNFTQTWRSRVAVERLSSQVAPKATVLRDGVWQEILRRNVVPGDLLTFGSGDLIPADARLLEVRDLHVQQSALTGESLPVRKTASSDEQQPDSDETAVFLGTSVISGTATAIVTATGAQTRFGEVAGQLTSRPPETEFERGTRAFGFLIARVVFILVVFVFFVNALSHRDPLESLLFSIALGVGLTPEFLPMIMTITLAQGAKRMALEKVIVKHLEAIQNFGSIDVLCSDKTGTLTTGKMTLSGRLDPEGERSNLPYCLAYLNSRFESGVANPLDQAILSSDPPIGRDAAGLFNGSIDFSKLIKTDEIPFDFERRSMSVVVEGNAARLLITKGAPESVIARSSLIQTGNKISALEDSLRRTCLETIQRYSANGYRVAAVSYKHTSKAPPLQHLGRK